MSNTGDISQQRAYYMTGAMTPQETAMLEAQNLNPEAYTVVLCPSATAPQLVQPLQSVQVMDPVDQTSPVGTGLLFVVPVILPVQLPQIAHGVLGADGKPAGQIMMEGPPGGIARVIVPRKTLTPEATAELEDAETVATLIPENVLPLRNISSE
jgi:hypothetical protein